MNNVRCGQCGKPWKYHYLIRDLLEDEKEDLLRGHGCPACSWGKDERATGEFQLERIESIQRNTELELTRYEGL